MKQQTPSKELSKEEAAKKQKENKKIDETISASFPASDPPGWYAGKDKKNANRK